MKQAGTAPWYSFQSPFVYLRRLESQYSEELQRDNHRARVAADLYSNMDSTAEIILALLRSCRPLAERTSEGGSDRRKPRVTVDVDLTSQSNLTLRWHPVGLYMPQLDGTWTNKTDFTDGANRQLDQIYYSERPVNELMFIHDFSLLTPYGSPADPVTQLLVYATRARVNQWISAIADVFSVERRTDLDFTIRENQLVQFRVVSVAELTKEREAEWAAGFPAEWGMTLEEFAAVYVRAVGKDKCAAMNQDLKKAGHKFNLRHVREAVARIERHHGGILNQLDANNGLNPTDDPRGRGPSSG